MNITNCCCRNVGVGGGGGGCGSGVGVDSGAMKKLYTIYFSSCDEISICFNISMLSCLLKRFEICQCDVIEQRVKNRKGTMYENIRDTDSMEAVSYTHLRAHETPEHLVCRLLLEKK